MNKPVVNIGELELDAWTQGELYGASDVRIGPMIGVKDLGISYSEVQPGKSSCPFHNHHVEDELFIILEGEGTYRFGKQSYPIKAGDVLGAPAGGQETPHQIINSSGDELRYIAFANHGRADVIEYPDSGRIAVDIAHGNDKNPPSIFSTAGQISPLGYWDGEDIGDKT
jgi:uncharacterized cupin superfamily protein